MAVLSLALVSDALKEWYLEGLRYQLNDKASIILAQMEKTSEHVEGKEIVMALRYGRVGGIGNRADTGTLPTPNARKTKQAKWETKNIFSRFQITDKTIKASRSNRGAFASMLEQEIEDCEVDAKLDLSRQVLGDGTGVLATVSGSAYDSNVTTVTVDTTMYLAEGMLIDIKKANGTQRHDDCDGAEITAVTSATTFTIATGADRSVSNTDIVLVAGNHNLELTGLDAVIGEDTTLYGIDRSLAANKWLNSNLDNVNGELSETKIQSAIDDVETKSGSVINFLLCSKGVKRAYQNLQTSMKQHVNTLELKGGWKTLSYNGIPLEADKYVKPGRLYCLDLNDWKMYQMSDWEWMQDDGAMLTRVADKPAYEATLLKYCDIGCQRPRGQVRLYGITEHG